MKGFEAVAAEATKTSQRMDAMEGQVNRFTGALETFLGRIHIDDRLRLVPDNRRIGDTPSESAPILAPSPSLFPVTRSPSPTTFLDLPMDKDDDGQGVTSPSVHDTRTTPSDFNPEIRMAEVAPIGTGLGPLGSQPPADPALAPPDSTDLAPVPDHLDDAAPTFNVTPATPHGSQQGAAPTPTVHAPPPSRPSPPPTHPSPLPPLPHAEESAPPPRPRSRTPVKTLLDVPAARTTRSRSRSKDPN
jgi:hypothetical protein